MKILAGDNTETSVRSPSLQGVPSIFVTEFTASASGPCTQGYFYTSNTSGTAYMVVYSASGALIAQSAAVTLSDTITGWVSCTFLEFSVTSGTQYWIGTYLDGYGWNLGLGGTGSAIYDNNGGTWPTAPASTSFTVSGTGYVSTSNNFSAYLIENTSIPTIASVNGGSSVGEGSTSVPLTGTNFAVGMTAALNQPNGVSVNVPLTYVSPTSATLDFSAASMEPRGADQAAYTDSTYVTHLIVTVAGQSSTAFGFTYAPPTGVVFQTLTAVHPNPALRFETIPDLAVNDQIVTSGNNTGTAAAPAGLVLNSDGSFEFETAAQWQNFWVRVYRYADSAYTPWAKITVTGMQPGGFW